MFLEKREQGKRKKSAAFFLSLEISARYIR
jgi:hypothetical protein